MADDRPDDQRDERIATWLEPEPLDELTRRRLVTSAMQASADAPSPAASQRAWRWIATAALIVVVLVAALALFTAQSGNEAQLSDAGKALGQSRDRIQPASPSIAATRPPVDVGDFGDLDTPTNLRRLRTALEHARSAAVAPSNGGDADPDAGAETTANQLSTLACRDQLPAGTVTAVGSGTLDGRRALVVLTDEGDGARSIDAVLADPCEVRPLS
jgi:hypothetical protein